MLPYELGLPHEMVCVEMICPPAALMDRRALSAAFAKSEQILKQVQDDCKGWCMRLGPTARNVLWAPDHGNEEGHARASIQSCP